MSNCADYFAPIETTTRTAFLRALLGGTNPTTIPIDLRALLYLPVKSAGVGIPSLTKPAGKNYITSSVCISVFVDFLLDGTSLVIVDHQAAMLSSLFVPMDVFEAR